MQVKKNKDKRGIFVVVDGLDSSGKGEIERALVQFEQKYGKAVFDTISFSRGCRKGLPELSDFWAPPERYFDTIVTAEPTYAMIGAAIRDEIVRDNRRVYSPRAEIQAYSLDRLVNMQRIVIPALENGLTVIQSRCLASTITYQLLRAEEEGYDKEKIKEEILDQEGNKLQLLQYPPDLLMIAVLDDINKIIKRLEERKKYIKDDRSIFDNINFQKKLDSLYRSNELKMFFENHGTRVEYIDTSKTVDKTKKQVVHIYQRFLEDLK